MGRISVALSGTIIAVDGHTVRPVRGRRLRSPWAQRLDVRDD